MYVGECQACEAACMGPCLDPQSSSAGANSSAAASAAAWTPPLDQLWEGELSVQEMQCSHLIILYRSEDLVPDAQCFLFLCGRQKDEERST